MSERLKKIFNKRLKKDKSFIEMGPVRLLFVLISVLFAIFVMVLSYWIGRQIATKVPNPVWQLSIIKDILIAISTSIFASTVFYLLYSRTAEEKVLKEVSSKVSRDAIDYTLSLFQRQFERMMPAKIYPSTQTPTIEFNSDFDASLDQAQTFKYKGDTASYTTYRLNLLSQAGRLKEKEVKLLVLDPDELSLLEDRVRVEKFGQDYSKEQLHEAIESMRNKIFVTIVALFDISHKARIDIKFHNDHIFFRSEILDDGIFLTYCVGGEYPSTFLYSRETVTYDAFLLDFQQTWHSTKKAIHFDSDLKEEKIIEILKEMKCQINLDDLRKMKDERFAGHSARQLPII